MNVNAVYIRMLLYTVAAVVAAVGFGTFDAAKGTLTLNLNEIALAISAAAAANGFVFWKWGKK